MPDYKSPIVPFAKNGDEDYDIRGTLGLTIEGAADIGEVLSAVEGLKKGDHVAWLDAWLGLARRTAAIAESAAGAGHQVSAAEAFLRASTYFAVAVNASSASNDDSAVADTFGQHEVAWDGFITNTPTAVSRVDIPYGSSTLPGWFFRAGDSSTSGPTLVAVNGSDGGRSALWASCGAAALKRGYNVLMFDGPGQQSMLFEKGVSFRPDWEAVLSPVYDFLAAHPDVDAKRISVYGISQGGYWVARALAFEHRFRAAILDPGVIDVSTSWIHSIPAPLLDLLKKGEPEKFDKDMSIGMKLSPETARTWAFRARPYGTSGYAETIAEVEKYRITDVAAEISTPLLITAPDGEQFWPGQSEQLAGLAPKVATLVRFTAAEGADEHCQPLARGLTAQRIFDWLDEQQVGAAR